jgi:1-acyl-sn-glycerol-3-phosphate acyltransferase
MARDNLFRGFFGRLIHSVGAIPVHRGSADLKSIKTIISVLKDGGVVCLFPEATRTTDGRISPFKGGFSLLSRRSGASIVPVLLDGPFEAWPRQRKIFRPGGDITVWFGKPVTAEQVRQMDDTELAMALAQTLRGMQTELRKRLGKEPYPYI